MTLPSAVSASSAPPSEARAAVVALDDPAEYASFTELRVDAAGAREATSHLRISGMYCAACAGTIESALAAVPGVHGARVSASAERAEVRWNPARTAPSALIAAVAGAGYRAAPDVAVTQRQERDRERRRALWRLFVAGFCMMQVMMYASPAYFTAPGEIPADLLQLLQWASWLISVPVVLFSAGGFIAAAWRQLRAGHIGMDVPVSLGILVTFIVSSGATFDPGGVFGREVYFDSLTMFVFFLLGGRYLELKARHRVAASLEAAVSRLPETVLRLDAEGHAHPVGLRQLRLGDRLRLLPGQAFPADGRLLSEAAQADEALLTGESRPITKHRGDEVVAGSINLVSPAEIEVLRLGADTRFEGIVALMRSAMTQRPALVQTVDRFAGPFLWSVLLLAAGAAAVWSVIDPSRAVWVAVSVLIVTCPCALSLATPSALLAGAGALARQGVLLQRLDALEALAGVDELFIDKTGTLTSERLALVRIELAPAAQAARLGEDTLLGQAASLARSSLHPLSRALVEAASQAADVPALDDAWHAVEERAGRGLRALDAEGHEVRLGSRSWIDGDTANTVSADDDEGSRVWFGRGGVRLACFVFAEALREDAVATLQQLRAEGIRITVLSGDHPSRVTALAARLPVDDARGGCTPEDKLAAIAEAQRRGRRVAMVGDGLNDAPVLARADVSFALAEGAAIAQARADAVLLGARLGAVAQARTLARRTLRVIRQNLGWAAAYNAACIPLALTGCLPPWAAGLGMATSSLVVVLNALRLSRLPA